MRSPLIKICGITRPEDAALGVELGVWALGFILAESPRRVSPGEATELVALVAASTPPPGLPSASSAPHRPLTVGVFVDEPLDTVVELAGSIGLSGVQLHGEETPAYLAALRRALPGVTLIKALGVPPCGSSRAGGLRERAEEYRPYVDYLLLDTRVAGRSGGTGTAFDWALARPLTLDLPVLVAGGIDPHSAPRALAVSGALGVDVSSGVESRPGCKDAAAVRRLVERSRSPQALAASFATASAAPGLPGAAGHGAAVPTRSRTDRTDGQPTDATGGCA